MFERCGGPDLPAPQTGAGRFGASARPGLLGEETFLDVLAAMGPGATLAGVLERLVVSVLPGAGEAPTAQEPAAPQDAVPGGALLDEADPGEQALLRAAVPAEPGEVLVAVDELAGLGAQVLSELVAACGRLASWASWLQALMAAGLMRTPDMCAAPVSWGPGGRPERFVTEEESRFRASCEIACRLGVSRSRAGRLLDRGQALGQPDLAPTEALHRVGLIDEGKTSVIVDRLSGVDSEIACAVQADVLPRAHRRTHAQLARDLDRSLTALDPDGAAQRRRRNTAQRRVSRPRPAGEGVSEMRLLLPTADSFLLDATLDAVAASARSAGDERSLSQLRADALVGMSLGVLRGSQHAACREGRAAGLPGAGAEGCVEPAPDRSALTASVGDACPADRLMPDCVPLEGLLTALSGLVGSTSPWWTPSGTPPVLFPPGLQISVDVTVPLTYLTEVLEDDPPPARPPDPGATAQEARIAVGGRSAPVPAVVARSLAAGGTWRRIVTDPLSGAVVDVGRTRYRPPAALADAVRARDVSCVHPGCEVPARRCDLDHLTPWSEGGTTSLDNLTCLCEAHHRLKHTPGWSLTRTGDGALTWGTPSGARYLRETGGRVVMLARRVGPRSVLQPARTVPDHLACAVGPVVLARLERGLAQVAAKPGADSSGPAPASGTRAGARVGGGPGPGPGVPRLETRGPRPGERAGDFETVPYPQALHDLGLAPLLDAVVPF